VTLRAAAICAALAGFVSLSSEILWFRVYSYITGGSPITFGLMLGVYLAGLAVGADIAGKICKARKSTRPTGTLASFAIVANVGAFFVIPMMAASTRTPGRGWLALIAVLIAAGFFGALLPLISHLGVKPNAHSGEKISYIYFANILGSVSGSLVTGFVLSDIFATEQIALLLGLSGLALPALVIISSEMRRRTPAFVLLVLLALTGVAIGLSTPSLFDRLYEKLQFKNTYRGQRFAHIVENKHGVVAVSKEGETFGGGVYDGHVSTDLVTNHNGIERAYIVPVVHPHPRSVLMIGMSTGAWAQVIAGAPNVDSLTIVEINPGYLELIKQYPVVSSLLQNPKVRIVIDDGRRWMTHNPNRRFDVIVSNTTFHYRANTTNLLSIEFMRLVHAHLKPGGIFHFNTTSSQDAMKTAFTEFPHGMRVLNFVAVSDSAFALDSVRWRSLLENYRVNGRPLFDFTRARDRERFEKFLALPGTIRDRPSPRGLETRESVLSRIPKARIITDDNMLPEWHELLLFSTGAGDTKGDQH
jgi:spermidine synthase